MITEEAIYRDYHGKVLSYIRAKINSPQDAEDIAADVFLKVCEKLDTFDETKASLFDYQHFENNARLAKLIGETESRYARELSDEDLSLVNAAGEPACRAISIEQSAISADSCYGAGAVRGKHTPGY